MQHIHIFLNNCAINKEDVNCELYNIRDMLIENYTT